MFGCNRVDLHQSFGAIARNGFWIEVAFHFDDGAHQQGVDLIEPGVMIYVPKDSRFFGHEFSARRCLHMFIEMNFWGEE